VKIGLSQNIYDHQGVCVTCKLLKLDWCHWAVHTFIKIDVKSSNSKNVWIKIGMNSDNWKGIGNPFYFNLLPPKCRILCSIFIKQKIRDWPKEKVAWIIIQNQVSLIKSYHICDWFTFISYGRNSLLHKYCIKITNVP
jgi:hypothetical protein